MLGIERGCVCLPCHTINAGGSLPLELVEGPNEQVRRYVVHQRRELLTLVPLRGLSYAGQRL
jgi:mono/diheme cytochrome c family protein